jgi:concanavalin A-like lectin/glucanase superfamily protein
MSTPSSVVVQYPVTVLLAPFTMPIVGNTAMATVGAMQWMVIGQTLSVAGLGILSVVSTLSATSVVLQNTGATGNAISGTVALAGASVGVAGTPGTPGQTFGQTNTTLAAGLNSNVATGGLQTLRIGGPTGPYWIGGLTPPTSGNLATLVIIDTTGQLMGVMNADAASTAAWQINVDGAQAEVITYAQPKAASELVLQYDFQLSNWKLLDLGAYRATHIDPKDFGADPNGVVESSSNIQQVVSLAISSGGTKPVMLDGSFAMGKPLFVTGQVHITGASMFKSILFNNSPAFGGWSGPAIVCAIPGTAPAFTTDGQGVTFATIVPGRFINFSKDGITLISAGYGALTFQFYINVLSGTLTDDQESAVFASYGNSEDGTSESYKLSLFKVPGQPTNSIWLKLLTNNGTLEIYSNTVGIPANTKTHVAWSFDGTSLYLFIAGVLVGTATGTPGSVTAQSYKEDLTMGVRFDDWPSAGQSASLFNNIEIADVRVDNAVALYTTSFTPPTGPLAAPSGTDGGWLLRFGSSFVSSVNPQWGFLTKYFPGYTPAPCWYVYNDPTSNILIGCKITNLQIVGSVQNLVKTTQEGIRCQQTYNMNISDVVFNAVRCGITFDKNCVECSVSNINLFSGGAGATFAYSNAFTLLASGNIRFSDVYSQGAFNWGLLTNSGSVKATNMLMNYLIKGLIWDASRTGQTGQPNGSIYDGVSWDDEGSSLAECVCMFGYKSSLRWDGGGIVLGTTTSPPVHATIRVQACTNLLFENTAISAPNSTNGYIFSFIQPSYTGQGIGAKQVIPIRVTNQGLGTQGHWIDPANPGEIILEGQETSGFEQINFTSNATLSVSFDVFLNRAIQFTDTGAVLTGTTSVKLPAWWVREREIVNWTAQTLTIQGPSVPAAWATSTAYVVGAQVTQGGYTYSCTTAITSSATAPTATAYGATSADAGGAWTCFGPTQTISVTSGSRAKIWSDGVQLWLA